MNTLVLWYINGPMKVFLRYSNGTILFCTPLLVLKKHMASDIIVSKIF